MPALIVVGGPNGSGKTTLASYLIQKGRIKTPVINPDEIALNELGGYDFRVKAAKVALIRRNEALSQHIDYAFETTFSGNSEINEIIAARSAGYKLVLYYVALESVLDNVIRVEERRTGLGHHVEIEDIFRRHEKSKLNLLDHLHFFDKAYLFDNSESRRSRVAIFNNGKLLWLNKKHIDHPFYEDLFKR